MEQVSLEMHNMKEPVQIPERKNWLPGMGAIVAANVTLLGIDCHKLYQQTRRIKKWEPSAASVHAVGSHCSLELHQF